MNDLLDTSEGVMAWIKPECTITDQMRGSVQLPQPYSLLCGMG